MFTPVEWKHTDSPVKKKFRVQQSVKKVMLRLITVDFHEKRATENFASYYQLLWQKFILFIEWYPYISVVLHDKSSKCYIEDIVVKV